MTAEKTRDYVVITGASSGIGWEAARAFARRGKNLIITARRRQRLEELRDDIRRNCPGVDVVVREMDLSVPENAYALYQGLAAYPIGTWVNNAGFGWYGSVAEQNLGRIEEMLRLDVEAVVILSTLYARDYRDQTGAQLINISSAGGYTLVPRAVSYCAAKFFVSAFTEGLARELTESGAKLRAKVLAPAATRTGFGQTASGDTRYNYADHFPAWHTSRQMAGFLLRLYDSDRVVGAVDRATMAFRLEEPRFPYAGG